MSNRIVVDTSIFVSAIIGTKGASRQVIRLCLNGDIVPLMSNSLFLEYEAVISRREILERCILTELEIRNLINAFYSVCRWIQIYYLWRPNLIDENDNFLIELAIAGNCKTIVTKNLADFRNAELEFEGLQAVHPEQFMKDWKNECFDD